MKQHSSRKNAISIRVIVATSLCLSVVGGSAVAQLISPGNVTPLAEYQLQKEIEFYKASKWTAAVSMGKHLLEVNPANVMARYYLAAALSKLGERKEALAEFAQTYSQTTDAEIKDKCSVAIQALNPSMKIRKLEPAITNAVKPNSTSTKQTAKSTLIASPPMSTVNAPLQASPQTRHAANTGTAQSEGAEYSPEKDILEKKQAVLMEGEAEVKKLEASAEHDVDQIKKSAAEQMADYPRLIPGRTAYRQNPEFEEASMRVNGESQKKIDQIEKELAIRKAQVIDHYSRKAAAYSDAYSNMQSQLKPGTSLIQMSPLNSNQYLRNYVNYDDSVRVGLNAKIERLNTTDGKLQNSR